MNIACFLCLLPLAQAEPDEAAREARLGEMRRRASETKIMLSAEEAKATLIEKPLFRYSDEQRGIEDATLWGFHESGQPVSFLKVEKYPNFPVSRRWLYCFASLSPEKIGAEWSSGEVFQAKAAGLEFKPLADAPAPAASATTRLAQLRQMSRRFSASILRNPENDQRDEMRLMPAPLHRYSSDAHHIKDGAVFGLTGTGTNPDALVAIQIRDEGAAPVWEYAATRMTAEGLTVKLDDQEVWSCKHERQGFEFDTWVFFHRPPDE